MQGPTFMHSSINCRTADPECEVPPLKSRLCSVSAVLQNGTSPYFGAVVGRVANRIANAQFTLDGQTYHVTANDGNNSLHGGVMGWSRHVWEGESIDHPAGQAVRLTYVSPDGDEVCMQGLPWSFTVLAYPAAARCRANHKTSCGTSSAPDVCQPRWR